MIRHIDTRACISCGVCEMICPGDVIVLDEARKARIKYPQDCWTCFSSELSCPLKAIDVHPFRKPKPMAW